MLSPPLEASLQPAPALHLPARRWLPRCMCHWPRLLAWSMCTATLWPALRPRRKVQARLGEVMRILAEAADLLGGDVGKAALWFSTSLWLALRPDGRESLVGAGHAAAVVTHLGMLRDGSYA